MLTSATVGFESFVDDHVRNVFNLLLNLFKLVLRCFVLFECGAGYAADLSPVPVLNYVIVLVAARIVGSRKSKLHNVRFFVAAVLLVHHQAENVAAKLKCTVR